MAPTWRTATNGSTAHLRPWSTRPGGRFSARLGREDGASISALAEPFAIKLPAVMKHLDVLGAAGLITRSKAGRTVTIRLRPEPMREAMNWLSRYERFWSKSLDRLAAYAEAQATKTRKAEAQKAQERKKGR